MLVRVAAQLIAQITIMRMLGPDLVGAFGYVLLLYGVLALVVDQGFGWSLIKGRFGDDEVAVVFTRLMLAGAWASLLVFGLSYPLAYRLENPLVGSLLRWSAPSYLLIGPYAIAHARLRQQLRFRELQFATTGAYMLAYPGIGVAMALLGCGVWSLLGAWYAAAFLQIVVGHYYAPHSLRMTWPWRQSQAGSLGRQVAGINVLNWMVDNVSGVFVGSMGAQALGTFNAASTLGRQPSLQLAQMLQVLLFSAASAVEGNADRIRKLYLTAVPVVGYSVGMVYALLHAHAELVIAWLLGMPWHAAAPVLAALSPGMVALALSMVTGSILTANDGQSTVIRSQATALVLLVAALAWASTNSIEAVAWSLSAGYAVRLAMQMHGVVRSGAVSWVDLALSLRGPVLASAWLAVPLGTVIDEAIGVHAAAVVAQVAQIALLLLLLRLTPLVFVTPALVDLLRRSVAGQRVLAALGVRSADY
jgi:O-antigen/teichoic acid export membrane protein